MKSIEFKRNISKKKGGNSILENKQKEYSYKLTKKEASRIAWENKTYSI